MMMNPPLFHYCLLLLFLFVCMTSQRRVDGDDDSYYAAYMVAMVKEQTVSACEGEILSIRCPSMTTISILAATYGRREEKCQTSTTTPMTSPGDADADDDVTDKCKPQQKSTSSSASLRPASECDEKRFCEIVVNSRDNEQQERREECANLTYLYLQVKYKCRIVTDELKRKVSCSGDSLKLRCPQRIRDTFYFLYVYDVMHTYDSECETNYPSTMSYCNETEIGMMKLISNECFNKTRCSIHVPRDLCNNSIRISYLCLPQKILTRRKPHQIYKFLNLQKTTTTTTTSVPTTTSTTATTGSSLTPFRDVTTDNVTPSTASATSSRAPVTSSSVVAAGGGNNSTSLVVVADVINTTEKLRGERGANQSSMTSFNVTSAGRPSSSHPLHFITSLITLMQFVQENSDRILMVVFAITAILLFCVCIFLFIHYEQPCSSNNNKNKNQQQQNKTNNDNNKSHNPSVTSQQQQQQQQHDHESASLLGGGGPDVQVHSTGTDGGASKRMVHMWRTHLLGGAWCASCCKSPWKRGRRGGRQQQAATPSSAAIGASDAGNCYRVVNHRRASSISDDDDDDDEDDDVISAVVRSPTSTTNNSSHQHHNHHAGMMLMPLEGSKQDETRYGAFPVNRYDDDATSLYEFPDQPNTALQAPAATGNGLYVGSGHAGHVYATTRDRTPLVVVTSNNTSPRGEPPPFPKPSRYEQQQQDLKKKLPIIQQQPQPHRTSTAKFPYHCHHHHHHHPPHHPAVVPHYATQRNNTTTAQQQQQQQQYRYAQNVMLRHLPARQGPFPSTFTTQPYHQQRHESTAFVALRHQLTTSSSSPVSGGQQQQQQQQQQERRGSFYDNSLPRDSPLYEYYQSELPGTRNLNQYFS